MKIKVADIIEFLNENRYEFEFLGSKNFVINDYYSVNNIMENGISWVKNQSNFQKLDINKLNNVLLVINNDININKKSIDNLPIGIISCDDPKLIFFTILNHYFYDNTTNAFISESAIVESEHIEENVRIGHNCYIGKDVTIERNVTIMNNVSIEGRVFIGEGSIIHSGVVIGTDGFGYYKNKENAYEKVPHFGGVIIGKNVEIGANTCIDKGTLDNTIIGNNVKIDNLCHIGHNVVIDDDSLVIALSMLGGSAHLRYNSYIAPGAIIANQIEIGENSLVGLGAVVLKNVEPNTIVAGVPAKILKTKKTEE